MKTADFDYDLPPSSIAQHPADRRDGSRLLHLPRREGPHADHPFLALPKLLKAAGVRLMVFNDTKVLPARLFGSKPTGGRVEFLLLEPQATPNVWTAMAKSAKPLAEGTTIALEGGRSVTVREPLGQGRYRIDFGAQTDAREVIETVGSAPLPPYIRRDRGGDADQRLRDRLRYQTIYATSEGAVAAPTAGLHFTQTILDRLSSAGIERVHVTLHVGAGTFAPVRVENAEQHQMHTEKFTIEPKAADRINRALAAGRKILAVGTTSCRTLESAVDDAGRVRPQTGSTALFIRPGSAFRVIDGLLTNFHLPRSTLLMLVSALAGRERILRAYAHAARAGYRFYSYGDAMLIL